MAVNTLNLFPANVRAVNPDGTLTPEFLRALLKLGNVVTGASSTSAGVDPAVGGVVLSNFSMEPSVPVSRRWEYPLTNPNGWNSPDGGITPRSGQMTFDGEFISTNYFTLNPGAHVPIGLRCDTDTVASTPRFHGIIMGNVVGAQEGADFYPTTQIETRATGLDPGGTLRYLLPNSIGPRSKPLQDGVNYKLCIRSTVTENGQRFVRYQLWQKNTAHSMTGFAGDLIIDTGDMLDPNEWLDTTKQGLVFASVGESVTTPGAWSIGWSNCRVTWAGVKDSVTDTSVRVARYDAQVEGDLTFIGPQRRFYMYTDSTGVAFNDWSRIVSSTTNSNTSVVAGPNGTSTAANFFAVNKSDLSGDFAGTSLGMAGARAELTTIGVGASGTPELDIKIGLGAVSTFKTTGQDLAGDFTFAGTGRKLYVYCTTATYANWTRAVSQTANGPTTFMAAPNGTSTAANFAAVNSSSLVNFGYAGLGMNGARAELTTLGVGTAGTPELDVKIGLSAISTFKTTGQDLAGDFTFTGTGRKLYVYCTTATYPNWTQVVSQTANGSTTLLAVPNGTSTAANFASTNSSSLVNFGYAGLGMNGSRAELTTLGVGTAGTPELDVKVGTTTASTFKTTGQDLFGNLTFSGNARRIGVYNDSTLVNFNDWTRFTSTVVNSNTTVVAGPNGSATASNFLATNNSNLTGSFGSVSFGMSGSGATLQTLGVGGASNPPMFFNIGGATPLSLDASSVYASGVLRPSAGIVVNSAAETIGNASTRITGATNVGGTNALGLAASAQNFETYCTTGQIKAAVNGAATVGDGVETVLRGLWGEFSCLVADLQARKIL